ncbi:MAG: hypothetical protein LBJ64_09060 [Deltaproteobacteria bacterium]|jgi:hypothetical protein|nr:hypothetical protein [Deltaproteobacteria bacterium]
MNEDENKTLTDDNDLKIDANDSLDDDFKIDANEGLDGDFKMDANDSLDGDLSLDAPDLEPSSFQSAAESPKSQAVKDLEGLDEIDLGEPQPKPAASSKKKKKNADAPVKKDVQKDDRGGYRWFFVHFLALLGLAAFAVGSFLLGEPYSLESALIALAVIVLTIPTMKTFQVKTRAGLAGLGGALGLAVCSLYNPDAMFLPGIPMALVWTIILVLVWIWLVTAIIRHEDMRKNKVSLVLSAILLYPLLAPGFAILELLLFKGQPIYNFNLQILNNSPSFITDIVPWFFWPQALLAFLVPPLASVFLLRDQLVANKNAPAGQRHFGALWLSLGGFVILIYSFMSFAPAKTDFPGAAASLRGLLPGAAQYYASLNPPQPARPLVAARRPPVQPAPPATPAVQAETAQTEASLAETAGGTEVASVPAAAPPAAETAPIQETAASAEPSAVPPADSGEVASNAEKTEGLSQQPPAGEPAVSAAESSDGSVVASAAAAPSDTSVAAADAPAEPAASAGAEQTSTDVGAGQETAVVAQTDSQPVPAKPEEQDAGGTQADQNVEVAASPEGTPAAGTAQAGSPETRPQEETGLVRVTSLEVGHNPTTFAPVISSDLPVTSLLALEADSAPEQPPARDLSQQETLDSLIQENLTLKTKIAVLEAQNELLRERMQHQDQIIYNLTTP